MNMESTRWRVRQSPGEYVFLNVKYGECEEKLQRNGKVFARLSKVFNLPHFYPFSKPITPHAVNKVDAILHFVFCIL